ncbi:MAG: PH domain-containing protein [Anaerolineae bacterium]
MHSAGVDMSFKPNKSLGIIIGLVIILTIASISAYLAYSTISQPFGLSFFFTGLILILSLPLLGIVSYWFYGLVTLKYRLDRSQVLINCGNWRYTIPLASITRVVSGSQLSGVKAFHGVGWPGYLMGRYQTAEGTILLTHSTEPLDRQLVIFTPQGSYGISPGEMNAFVAEMRIMLAEGATRVIQDGRELATLGALPLWRDSWYWAGLLIGAIANLTLWGLLAGLYPGLPGRLPLHFDPRGRVDLIGPKEGLLIVPLIGSMAACVNGLLGMVMHHRERFAAYLLLGVNILVQAMSWIAALRIIG